VKVGRPIGHERLAALRSRLAAESLLTDSLAPNDSTLADSVRDGAAVYDSVLAARVARYQAQHGMTVDSNLSPETVRSLNLPAEYRLGQVAANLERLRWLPRSLGTRYIFVNVPAFTLQAYDTGTKVLEMKVIVGSEYNGRRTPVFSDSMRSVVFRPFWTVPDPIASREIWPKAHRDPGYLARNHYQVARIDGAARVRQLPGEGNALGLVKFLFPNDFSVYLHDTPDGRLFEKDVRAFSHGCIRVERPDDLAAWVLRWPIERVREEMDSGRDDQEVRLTETVPVYITYLTAYAPNGELRFGNDLYLRDDTLVKAMQPALVRTKLLVREIEAIRRLTLVIPSERTA
jgi:L,D-transpeptidase YcbB